MTALPLRNYFLTILACVPTRREFFCLDFARVAGLSRGFRGRTARGATLATFLPMPGSGPQPRGRRPFFQGLLTAALHRALPGLCSLGAMVLLSGCAGVEAWARNHEREYRAEYREGGGSISMTVRPAVTRGQIERMFRELEAQRLPGGESQISNFKSQIAPEGVAK